MWQSFGFNFSLNADHSEPFWLSHIQRIHFNLHFKEKKEPNNCHTYYIPNLQDFHAFLTYK
jgi:hypothetical protein